MSSTAEPQAWEVWGEPTEPDVEMTVPDTVPGWLLEEPPTQHADPVPHVCGCGCTPEPVVEPVVEPVRWAVPGVWDEPAPVAVGPLVAQLEQVVAALASVEPTSLPEAQALLETEALLEVGQRVRVQVLSRIQDVHERRLYREREYRTTNAWLRGVAPDATPSDVTLAKRLPDLPHVTAALQDGGRSI